MDNYKQSVEYINLRNDLFNIRAKQKLRKNKLSEEENNELNEMAKVILEKMKHLRYEAMKEINNLEGGMSK